MTATTQFIEDAIKGGWGGLEWRDTLRVEEGSHHHIWVWGYSKEGESHGMPVAPILLNPLAWKAVGKTRGWEDECLNCRVQMKEHKPTRIGKVFCSKSHVHYVWRREWRKFIDHLADGKTIDEALKLIT